MRNVFWALLALTACNDGGDTNDTSETGVQTGVGTVTYEVYKPADALEPCVVNYDCDSGAYSAKSGKSAEIDAPSECTVEIGTAAPDFTFMIHKDLEGNTWASPLQDVSVAVGENPLGRADLFRIFQPGVYACSYDKYKYQSGPSDHKGEFLRHVDLPDQRVEVDHGGKVNPEDDQNME